MGRYVAGRLLKAVLLLLAVSAVVFFVFAVFEYIHLLPDNHARQMYGPRPEGLEVSPEEEQTICEEYGLKRPGIVERSSNFIKSMFSLEMGCTPKFRAPVQGANMESTQ